MNMKKHGSWLHQKLLENNREDSSKTQKYFITVLIHLFDYIIFSFRKLTFDELVVVIKECQLSIFLLLRHIQSETQSYVIEVFPRVEGDETFHIVDGTYSKCIAISIISDALDWCCGDSSKFSHAHEGFMFMHNKQAKQKTQQKVLFEGNPNRMLCS